MKLDLLEYPFTEKQRKLIEWIEDTLEIKYDLSNLSDWINKWRPIAEQEDWERQLRHELEMEIIDARRDW